VAEGRELVWTLYNLPEIEDRRAVPLQAIRQALVDRGMVYADEALRAWRHHGGRPVKCKQCLLLRRSHCQRVGIRSGKPLTYFCSQRPCRFRAVLGQKVTSTGLRCLQIVQRHRRNEFDRPAIQDILVCAAYETAIQVSARQTILHLHRV
jgi:hypothetical protein